MSKSRLIQLATLALCLACPLAAQGQTSISYQGELRMEGQPFNGTVDMRFELWNSANSLSGTDRLGSQTKSGVQVINGLFQVDDLVLGSTAVWRDEANRWLQIIVDPGGPDEQFLWPRQRIHPAPMAWVSRRGTAGGDYWSVFNTNGQSIFRVYNNSRVSIGNQAPRQHLSIGSRLDLYTGNANSPTVPSIRGSSADNLVVNAHGSGATYINHDSGSGGVRFHNGTSNGELMRLTGGGQLGIGTNNPQAPLHVIGTTRTTSMVMASGNAVNGNPVCRRFSDGVTLRCGFMGIGTNSPEWPIHVIGGIRASSVRIDPENIGSSAGMCMRGSGQTDPGRIGFCASSQRYKNNIESLTSTSNMLSALRPVRFNWTESGVADIGLIAEEVAEVIPELAERNSAGEIEGVNFRHLTAVLLAGWQEQQLEIEAQKDQIATLHAELVAERQETSKRLAALEAMLIDGLALAEGQH